MVKFIEFFNKVNMEVQGSHREDSILCGLWVLDAWDSRVAATEHPWFSRVNYLECLSCHVEVALSQTGRAHAWTKMLGFAQTRQS
jgi:hypothetical protein